METPASEPDANSHLRAEIARAAASLARQLARLRQRGKSLASEAVRGFVIEEGEAEGIAAELTTCWNHPESRPSSATPVQPSPEPVPNAGCPAGGSLLPLRRAAERFALTEAEYAALLLTLSVELDARFGRLIAYLNDHIGSTRPTIGLSLSLEATNGPALAQSALAFLRRPLIRDGLLETEGDEPAPGLTLRLSHEMAQRLTVQAPMDGVPEGFRLLMPEPGLLNRLVLPDKTHARLVAWSQSLRNPAAAGSLVLSGLAGSGRTTAARGALGEVGRTLLVVDLPTDRPVETLRAARREARWHGAALLVKIQTPPPADRSSWRSFWAELAGLAGPLLIAVAPGLTEAVRTAAPFDPPVISFPEPELAERVALWRSILPKRVELPAVDVDQLAARFRFNAGRIHLAVRRAAANAAPSTNDGDALTPRALMEACRELGSTEMGSLAQKLPLPYAWEELIVPPAIRAELDLARTWVRQQRKVLDQWGFSNRLPIGRGLTMLFSGPPGTGKTMAAQVLAREWDLDLYRVDLSRTVSKYIGETEKNLGTLFDEARASGAVLFFDEADALFGKRSEVKDAHDRYANLEIGYLLQRMEEYDGVTMLASNRARDLDEAFVRRFHFMIDFPMPDEAHRLKIWEGMFPSDAEREAGLDLRPLANEYEISGGEIKNTVLAGAYIAAGGGRPIGLADLQRAVRREFVKSGRVLTGRRGGKHAN